MINTRKIAEYTLHRKHELRPIPSGHEVNYMSYRVHGTAGDLDIYLSVPCRAKLHHALTGLFYNWDWKDEEPKEITFDEAYMLKHVFGTQTEYKLWKKTMEKINELGADKAKEWLIDQVKVLALRNVLRGE